MMFLKVLEYSLTNKSAIYCASDGRNRPLPSLTIDRFPHDIGFGLVEFGR
jgi:hypothetical protein